MKRTVPSLITGLRRQRSNKNGQRPFSATSLNLWGVLAPVLFVLALFTLDTPFATAQSCRWDGTAPFCSGSCGANENELTRLGSIPDFWVPPFVEVNPPFGANCVTGSKALCCSTPGPHCRWDGTAPFCSGSCQGDEVQASPPPGSSSGASCWTGSKVYCCNKIGSTGQPLVAADCSSGPGTCAQGFVWREANSSDHVCVTPQVRDQARSDNAQAAARRSPTGGPSGPDTCVQGFVWREAFSGDHVCVTPQTRSEAAQDNGWSKVRDACPSPTGRDCSSGPGTCVQGFVWREANSSDHVCVTPQVRQQTSDDNAQAAGRRSQTGGPYGPDTCVQGFVWREAFSGDHACVTPATRAQAAQDNNAASGRNACP
jgi:hypothetical protein